MSDVETTSLSSSMQRSHAISGGQGGVCLSTFHQVVHAIQVTILSSEVHCGVGGREGGEEGGREGGEEGGREG